MSVLGKKWVIKNTDTSKKTLEKILENRDISKEEKIFHDPFLFEDMKKSVERVKKAIESQERIIVFGDYDVDGITGTAILVHVLNGLGAKVSYRLPNRMKDGYGLSEKYINELAEKDVKLLITVDCGISCETEIELGAEKGIDTIITDHHTVPENGAPSKAFSVLHPRTSSYPFKDLTGAGVALKLAQALHKGDADPLIDLAALGTVADLGPLKGENWLIVKRGLKTLSNTKWIGLKKIMELAEINPEHEFTSFTIGYRIAPRINAAGRIGDPYLALSLILREKEDPAIHKLGRALEDLNENRKEMTTKAMEEAEREIDENNIPYIFIAHSPDWHVGILGLIAGRLAEKYARPAIIMQDFGDTLVASARSRAGFNIIEAISEQKDLLISFGGHAQAAGFDIKKENLKKFKENLSQCAKKNLKDKDLKPSLMIDCPLTSDQLNFELVDELNELKPFGIANEKPLFILRGVEPLSIKAVGKEYQHLKFTTRTKHKDINTIAFRMGEFADNLRKHRKIDIVFHLERNSWNNKENLQLEVLDFRQSEG